MRSKNTSREVRPGDQTRDGELDPITFRCFRDRPCIAKEYNFDFHLDSVPDHPLTGPISISISVPDLPLRN